MVNPLSEEGDWYQYRRLVLSELERIDASITALKVEVGKSSGDHHREISEIRVDVATLKVKAAAFGAVGGFVITVISELIIKGFH